MATSRGGDGVGAHDPSPSTSYDTYYNNAAHPNTLPPNVINAYSGNFEYSNQPQQHHQHQSQQHQQPSHLPPALASSNDFDQSHEAAIYGNAGGEDGPDADATADYSLNGLVGDGQHTDAMSAAEDDDDINSTRKRNKGGNGRVAKACQPCSSKKRRCDGGEQ